jgi:ABC-type polysaccharide/polyol phosphate export permease
VLINHQLPDIWTSLYSLLFGLAVLVAGYFIFSRRVPYFAEEV